MILEPPLWATDSWVADAWADGTWGETITPPHGEGGISVELPPGWLNFSGGGSDADLCGEVEPDGEIPPMEITGTGGTGGSSPELACIFGDHELTLEISGGVPPFIWAVLGGEISISQTDLRTATISIAPAIPGLHVERVGTIHYFKAHAHSFSGGHEIPQAACAEEDPNFWAVDATVDVRLRAYDCLFRYVPQLADFGTTLDIINVDDTNQGTILDNPIGDVVADRSCEIAHDWPVARSDPSGFPGSDPAHWSVGALGCNLEGVGGNVSIQVTATLAGKNGVHGTIHSSAPAFSETINIPMPFGTEVADFFDPLTGKTYDIEGENWIDVRTDEMIEAECCLIPAGHDLTVTVVDAENNIAIIIVPVVEPT